MADASNKATGSQLGAKDLVFILASLAGIGIIVIMWFQGLASR